MQEADYKNKTKQTYNAYPLDFDKKFQEHFDKFGVIQKADLFIKYLPGKNILDAGSGPGAHSVYFKDKGLNVFCIDISEEMVQLCKDKGLNAKVMDLENLGFRDNEFDGIWCYTSLLHIPKANVSTVVHKFTSILKKDGIIGLALKEGAGEGLEKNPKYPEHQRWFSYYSDAEIRDLFNGYEVLDFDRNEFNKYNFVRYILKKKN